MIKGVECCYYRLSGTRMQVVKIFHQYNQDLKKNKKKKKKKTTTTTKKKQQQQLPRYHARLIVGKFHRIPSNLRGRPYIASC